MIVIIGAGPAGLYLALSLFDLGVRDVVIYDRRAGQYERPGALRNDVYQHASKLVTHQPFIIENIVSGKEVARIKDLEQMLYKEACARGISIKSENFVRLYQNASSPGLIVANEEGHEERISAQYIFDCTGTKRAIVNAVNELSAIPAMPIKTILKSSIKSHVLAHGTLQTPYSIFPYVPRYSDLFYMFSGASTLPNFLHKMSVLNDFGWREPHYPWYSIIPFKDNENEVVIYAHAPEGLSESRLSDWINAVLTFYGHFATYIPYGQSKPSISLFDMSEFKELSEVCHVDATLPVICAIGDSQIDPDYTTQSGISWGFRKIDELRKFLTVEDGRISDFRTEKYASFVKFFNYKIKYTIIRQEEALKLASQAFLNLGDIISSPRIESFPPIFQCIREKIPSKFTSMLVDRLSSQKKSLDWSEAIKQRGDNHYRDKKYNAAVHEYTQAIQFLNTTNLYGYDLLLKIKLYRSLFLAYKNLEDFDSAFEAWEKAYALYNVFHCGEIFIHNTLRKHLLCGMREGMFYIQKIEGKNSLWKIYWKNDNGDVCEADWTNPSKFNIPQADNESLNVFIARAIGNQLSQYTIRNEHDRKQRFKLKTFYPNPQLLVQIVYNFLNFTADHLLELKKKTSVSTPTIEALENKIESIFNIERITLQQHLTPTNYQELEEKLEKASQPISVVENSYVHDLTLVNSAIIYIKLQSTLLDWLSGRQHIFSYGKDVLSFFSSHLSFLSSIEKSPLNFLKK